MRVRLLSTSRNRPDVIHAIATTLGKDVEVPNVHENIILIAKGVDADILKLEQEGINVERLL